MGWGEVVNGGFGLVLDGSESQGRKAELMLGWVTLYTGGAVSASYPMLSRPLASWHVRLNIGQGDI